MNIETVQAGLAEESSPETMFYLYHCYYLLKNIWSSQATVVFYA